MEIFTEQKTSNIQTSIGFESIEQMNSQNPVPVEVNVPIYQNNSLSEEVSVSSPCEDTDIQSTIMECHDVIVDGTSGKMGSSKLWVLSETEEIDSEDKTPKIYIDQCNNIDNKMKQSEQIDRILDESALHNSNCDNDVCLQMTENLNLGDDTAEEKDYSSGISSINKDLYNISGCSLDDDDPPLSPQPDGFQNDHETHADEQTVHSSNENLDGKLNRNSSSVNLFEPEREELVKAKTELKPVETKPTETKRVINRHIIHPYHWNTSSKSSVFDSSMDLSFSHDTDTEDGNCDVISAPGNIDKNWYKTTRSNSTVSIDPPEYFDSFGPRSWGSHCTCHNCSNGEKHVDSGTDTLHSTHANGLLQTQLEKTEKESKRIQEELRSEIKELKKDNERQQKLIGQNLSLGPEAKIEATMQHEITRLTSENLDLREEIDKYSQQIRMLKKMVKVYSKKLQAGEAAEIQAELERAEIGESNGALATVKHRERQFMGMLELKKEDENVLVKNLILDLKPKVAAGLIPGLPAYVLFMIVRQTDYANDDEKVRGLLTNTINGIKKVVKRHNDDLERITLWLANTCRLLHTLKQYSGEKAFQTDNTPKQNEQCLRNFDLSEYRQVFSDLAVWIYQGLLKRMEELIQPSIVPAILEHEAISGLNASKPSGLRGRASSNAKELDGNEHSLDSLMRALNNYMRIISQHAIDPELAKQVFRQVFYYICAGALNNLLLRKDMCNWSKGMQIRYNLSHLEQWLRDNKLHESGAITALHPIIQASQLLQARKTDSDVDSITDMCSKLTNAQIVKILNLYTPVDEFEERVPISFIRKIQEKLKSRDDTNNTLLMDTKYSYPVTFPFNPSNIQLETIDVPDVLHLGILKKV